MPTKTNNPMGEMPSKFKNDSKASWDTFKDDFNDYLKQNKNKLNTIAFEADLHRSVKQRITSEVRLRCKEEGITEVAAVTSAISDELDEVALDYNSDAFSMLMTCIADETLKKRLRRDHKDDAYAAIKYIDSLWSLEDNETRVNTVVADRKVFTEEGITKVDAPTVKAFGDRLLEFNAELEGTDHHEKDALLVTKVLDALAAAGGQAYLGFVRNFKATNKTSLKDFNKAMLLLGQDLEENDRVEAQAAARTQREALSVQLAQSQKAEAELRAEVRAMQVRLNALSASTGAREPESKAALRTGTRPRCPDCDGFHRGICIGKELEEGRITRAEAMAMFPGSVSEEGRGRAADAALQRYKDAKAKRAGTAPAPTAAPPASQVPAGQPPPRVRLGCVARVVDASNTDAVEYGFDFAEHTVVHARTAGARTAGSDGTTPPDPSATILRFDTQCEQHMFNAREFFPYGVDPRCNVSVRVADGTTVTADGLGTAVVWCPAASEWIEHRNALLVLGLAECLVATAQAYEQAGTRMLLEPDMSVVFPAVDASSSDTVVPLERGYTLSVRAPTEAEARRLAREDASPTHVVTRGKHPGRTTTTLHEHDLQQLWRARLGVSAGRLRALPDVAVGVPDDLRKAKMEFTTDDAAMGSSAPRIHPAPVDRPRTDHPGQLTVSDLKGPLPPSRFGGSRYCAQFTDVHLGKTTFKYLRTKDQYDAAVDAYITHWDGRDGFVFKGGTLYIDNEFVLNSAKVQKTLAGHGVSVDNSCEYEPWQNGLCERGWRTLDAHIAEMATRGFDDARAEEGKSYWPHCAAQSEQIEERVTHGWEGGDVTPFEKRTGARPDLSAFRPMFCLAFVRRPPALRDSKVGRQWDRALHLGTALSKPGYVFEMLEGPRAGKLVYASQAIFRELVFPRNSSLGGAPTEPTSAEAETIPDGLPSCYEDDDDHADPPRVDDDGGAQGGDDGAVDVGDAEDAQGDDGAAGATRAPPPHADDAPRRSTRATNNKYARGSDRAALPYTALAYSTRITGGHVQHVYQTCLAGERSTAPELAETPVPSVARTPVPRGFSDIANMPEHDQPGWYDAHYRECDRLFGLPDGRGLTATPRLRGERLLPLKTHYVLKPDGTKKARTTIGGHRMRKGIDYQETFSTGVRATTVRLFVASAAERDDVLTGGDIDQAYLHVVKDAKTRGTMPEGYEDVINATEHCVEVGNLYGGPDAGRYFYLHLRDWLKRYGLRQSEWDPCLYTYTRATDGHTLRCCVYVDDLLFAHTRNSDIRDVFAAAFSKDFMWKDFGTDLREFLSMRIVQYPGKITLDMERYISDMFDEFMPGGAHVDYPTPTTPDLEDIVMDAARSKAKIEPSLVARYQRIVCKMLYAVSNLAAEAAWAVGMLTRCLSYPSHASLHSAERVLIYLHVAHVKEKVKITYVRTGGNGLTACMVKGAADANFRVEHSTSGYCFELARAAVGWCVKKQVSLALYSTQAELMSASIAACEAVFERGVLSDDLGLPQSAATILLVDNSGAIDIAKDPVHHHKTRHMLRRDLFIRELVERGEVKVVYVKSAKNVADIFTKHLDHVTFKKHRAVLLNLPSRSL